METVLYAIRVASSMVVKVSEIRSIAESVRTSIPEAHGQCYPASRQIVRTLTREYNVSKESVSVKEVLVSNKKLRHYVVSIYEDAVQDADFSGEMIVDVTLDQYCTENVENGDVGYGFGPRDSIDNVNMYFTSRDSPYQ